MTGGFMLGTANDAARKDEIQTIGHEASSSTQDSSFSRSLSDDDGLSENW
jgi:hypothetical protein